MPRASGTVIAALIAALGGSAAAEQDERPRPPLASPETNFWDQVVDPFGEEVRVALTKARDNRQAATDPYGGYQTDDYADHRRRLLADAYGMLRYASRLAPDDPEVMLELGIVADELGHADEARTALESYLEGQIEERVHVEAHRRLGMLYAGLERYNRAIVHLQSGLAGTDDTSRVIVALAGVYMHLGRLAEAIDLLAHERSPVYRPPVLQLALAVAYDRDEQLTHAYEALESLHSMVGQQLNSVVDPLDKLRLLPAADRYYYRALAYEAAGHLSEARSEWQHYAGAGEARFRRRALEHIAAIDALLAEEVGTRREPPAQPASPPYPYHHGRPHP